VIVRTVLEKQKKSARKGFLSVGLFFFLFFFYLLFWEPKKKKKKKKKKKLTRLDLPLTNLATSIITTFFPGPNDCDGGEAIALFVFACSKPVPSPPPPYKSDNITPEFLTPAAV
jgi:hypothetical protein